MVRIKINKLLAEQVYSQNWKTVFNKLDAKYTNKVIDLVAEQEIYRQERTQDFFIEVYELYEKIRNDYMNKNFDNTSSYTNKLIKYCEEYKNAIIDVGNNLLIISKRIKEFYNDILNIVSPYAKNIDELHEIFKRIEILAQKFIQVSLSLDFHVLEENSEIVQDCHSLMNELLELKKKFYIKSYEENVTIKNNDNDYKKIFDYKKMNKLARDSGYIFNRQDRTDHAIYMHNITNKIVVIPQHDLGYGLMLEIQKQIRENAVA